MSEHTPAPTPSRSVYGFVLYLASNIMFLLYMIWALVPESWFVQLNITYLPQRYWAVAIPIFSLTMLATFAFMIYPSLNLLMTPDISDMKTITDKCSKKYVPKNKEPEDIHGDRGDTNLCVCKNKDSCYRNEYIKTYKYSSKYSVPMVQDLDISHVSELLYLN